jgi:hypothetical protein
LDSVNVVALAAVDLESHVYDSVGPIFLGLAP